MDGFGLDIQADMLVHVDKIGRLDHPLEAVDIHDDLIMDAQEGDGGHDAAQHALLFRYDIHVLGADDHVHGLLGLEALVHAVEHMARKAHAAVTQHHAVDDVALADEVGHEGVFRLVIDVDRGADLLNAALAHDDDRVGHAQCFLLVVRDKDEGDPGRLLDVFQLLLHILAQLQVQRGERLVQQQHLRPADQGACDRHALLLSAGEAGDAALFKALERHKRQHFVDALIDLRFRHLLLAQREGDVFKHVQVREERIALEDRVDVALVGRDGRDLLAHENDLALVGRFKAADDAQRRRFAAAGGTEKRQKFVVIDVQIDMVKHKLTVKGFGYALEFNDFFHRPDPQIKEKVTYVRHTSLEKTVSSSAGKNFSSPDWFEELVSKDTFYYSY